jgi:thymidylate kinase
MPKRGLFVAIYGINNLGKTTQAKILVERITRESRQRGGGDCRYLKYPLYDLLPTGPAINAYLREGNPLGLYPREFQMLQILNRTQFDGELRALLAPEQKDRGRSHVVAEDYWGTGVAWGMGAGVDKDFLIKMNSHLLKEDVAFLLDGRRFDEGREKNHVHESNDVLTEKVRLAHLELAKEFGWRVINANRPIEAIHGEIWSLVEPLLFRVLRS